MDKPVGVELAWIKPQDHVLGIGFGPGAEIEHVADVATCGFVVGNHGGVSRFRPNLSPAPKDTFPGQEIFPGAGNLRNR